MASFFLCSKTNSPLARIKTFSAILLFEENPSSENINTSSLLLIISISGSFFITALASDKLISKPVPVTNIRPPFTVTGPSVFTLLSSGEYVRSSVYISRSSPNLVITLS